MPREKEQKQTKLRIQARHAGSGKPLKGLPVHLLVETSKACADANSGHEIIGSLMTNADGVVIFANPGLSGALARGWQVSVNFGWIREKTYALDADIISEATGVIPFDLEGMEEAIAATDPKRPLPWTEAGIGVDDLWSSPASFPDLGDLVFGDDQCSRLIPSDQTLRIFEQNHVVLTERDALTCKSSVDAVDQEITLHKGELFSHEVSWRRLGYTFGDLLYSLALAPGEVASLAVSTWEQRQRADAARAGETGESQTGSATRASSLGETMNAASRQFGFGGSAVGSGKNSEVTLAVGIGGNFSRTDFSANAARDFADQIQQRAEIWRRDHQTLVAEQTESEDQSVSTRSVCNKNWSRVLNIFYHEVLENHRVTTRLTGTQDVYFIPHSVDEFDLERALCTRAQLEPYLLQPDLRRCYDAVSRLLFDPRVDDDLVNGGADPNAEEPDREPRTIPRTSSFRVEVRVGNNGLDKNRPVLLVVGLEGRQELSFAIVRPNRWKTNANYSHIVSTSAIDPSQIKYVGLKNNSSTFAVTLNTLTISFLDPNGSGWIRLANYGPGKIRKKSKTTRDVSLNWAPDLGDDEDSSVEDIPAEASLSGAPTAEDYKHCADTLVAHLNCHKFYYNSLLWLLKDRNERYHWLENFDCSPLGPLSDLIDPQPIAILGHYVAFVSTVSEFEENLDRPILDDRLVTLPTSGVFADAALGQCITLEDIPAEDDPFWKWVETPNKCDCTAPTLATPAGNTLLGEGGLSFLSSPSSGLASIPSAELSKDIKVALADKIGEAIAKEMFSNASQADLDKLISTVAGLLSDSEDKPSEDDKTKND